MNNKEYEVLVVVDIKNLEDKNSFDKYLRREGLEEVDGEKFAYKGTSSTPIFNTRAFIYDVMKKALQRGKYFDECKMIIQFGETRLETYKYDKDDCVFKEINI